MRLLHLQYFLGLGPLPKPPRDLPSIAATNKDNVVFVSIDFEGLYLIHQTVKDPGESNDMKTQVRLSILDTINLSLLQRMQSEHITLPQEAGSISSPLIGNSLSEAVDLADMKYELEKLLDRDRKLVFVRHGAGGDISVLKLLGVDLETSIGGYLILALLRGGSW